MPDLEVPVLIVGGSLVGLSSAMLLAQHGIRTLTVEHHRGTAVLVRPDGVVGWRAKAADATPGATVARALEASLCR